MKEKKSKYEYAKVNGWDDSEGFLTDKQVTFIIADEKAENENQKLAEQREYIVFSEEDLEQIYENEKSEERLKFEFTKEEEDKFSL
ncbi:hypothetical protein [Stutzerimonas zhaodongensis]|uniref:hypothetical protein n=1 Tax=Stutzerimonas zhaodongensis TaxID=1176257 RepID=UPI001F4EB27D|nr:hypothetical protein [Stutzerimonas zhaodongensis]UNG20218.1 hypothetical protein MKP10_08320 [Stutzerimonas zhaodongensis]